MMGKKILILFLGILLIGFVCAEEGVNATDGFKCSIYTDTDCSIYGVATPNITQSLTDLYLADPTNDFIFHLKKSGNSWSNQSDGFRVTVNNPTATAIQDIFTDGTNFWFPSGGCMYHTDKNGVNITSGFSLLTSAPEGIWRNGSDFWVIYNGASSNVAHFDKNGNNMTDGFSAKPLIGTDDASGITSNITSGTPTDFWISDYTTQMISHIRKNSTGGWENTTNFIRTNTSGTGQNVFGVMGHIANRLNFWVTANTQVWHIIKNETICNSPSLSGTPIVIDKETWNYSSYETNSETFIINLSSDGLQSVTAELIYNGINYGGTKRGNETNMSFIQTIEHPLQEDAYNSFYWNISYGASNGYLSCNPQEVYKLDLGTCSGSRTIPYLNISFMNESDNHWMRAELSSGTFYIRSGVNASLNRTISYTSSTENISVDFCMNRNPTILVDETVQASAIDFPQRILRKVLTLTNTVTNQLIYLLSSSDGIYVTFQVLNGNTEQPISNVDVVGVRDIGGTTTTVAQGTTDAAGSITFWLNPDYLHTFNFSVAGYDTYTTNLYPTQSSYTITLGGAAQEITNDYTIGISYLIKPSGDYLTNDTNYGFNFTLSSSYWTVSEFGFNLFYKNGSLAGSASDTTNGGVVNIIANTYNSSIMRMNFYYVINSSYYNGTREWHSGTGSAFSLKYFFDDLSLYMSAGIFGIEDFGRVIFCIVIMIMVVGGLTTRYGIQSEATIIGMFFALVYFLDVGIGLIPNLQFGGASIPHFVTIVAGLLTFSFIIKEELQ